MLELTAPEELDCEARAPIALALVLDRSGSMAGAKLEVAKQCARWLVSRLRDDDLLALVDYDDEVRLLAPLHRVGAGRMDHALARIDAGGMTNLSGGWLKGLEQLRGAPIETARKVLLLTDGLANQGITDPGALVALTQKAAEDSIGTTTIGLGENFDEDLLTAMADAGHGNAHYAPSPDAAPGIFAEEIEGLTSLVGQNLSVEIRSSEHVEVIGVLNEYPAVPTSDGVQIQIGDAYAADHRRVVLALHVPRLAELGPQSIADLVVRYVSVADEIAEHTLTVPVVVNAVSAAEAAGAAPDPEVHEEVLVLKAAKARDEAIRLADEGRFDEARLALDSTANDLRLAGLVDRAVELDADALLMATVSYAAPASRKQVRYNSNQARRRRR
jgi:Ca-activated chloride channel family protein